MMQIRICRSPEDSTGIEVPSNLDIFKWIGLLIIDLSTGKLISVSLIRRRFKFLVKITFALNIIIHCAFKELFHYIFYSFDCLYVFNNLIKLINKSIVVAPLSESDYLSKQEAVVTVQCEIEIEVATATCP